MELIFLQSSRMAFLCLDCHTAAAAKETDWVAVITASGAVLVGIAAIIFSYFQFKKSLNGEKLREERNEIRKKLDEFYGPLLQLRKKSSLLYAKFSEKFKKKDTDFRTLTYLLRGHKFEGNDGVLLREIIRIGEQSEELIHRKAGLIDDTNLRQNVIPRATTHYLIIKLAYEGTLQHEEDNFKSLTFPAELDGLLENRKRQLEARLVELNELE